MTQAVLVQFELEYKMTARTTVFLLALVWSINAWYPQAFAEQQMMASWYGSDFNGRTMANNEVFRASDPSIAAHRYWPFGTVLRLTNPDNGKSHEVVIKDRGPYIRGRSLDLSYAAAKRLGYVEVGVARLLVRVLHWP